MRRMKPNLSSNNMVQLENIEYVFITKAALMRRVSYNAAFLKVHYSE